MADKAPTTKTPPILNLSPAHPLAEFHLRIAMTWPKDRAEQERATAFFAASLLEELDASGLAHDAGLEAIQKAAEQQGRTLDDVLRDPAAGGLLEAIKHEWLQQTKRLIEDQIYNPAGGVRTLLRGGPGLLAIVHQMDEVQRRQMQVVGSVLCFLAQIVMHHPDLTASQNLGWKLFSLSPGGKPHDGPKVKNRFNQDWWQPWCCVAPLHAAYKSAQEFRRHEARQDPAAARRRWSEAEIAEILSWAKWLRTWAVTYVASGTPGGAPVISDREAMVILSDVPEIAPPLGPLNTERLAIARNHSKKRARANPSLR